MQEEPIDPNFDFGNVDTDPPRLPNGTYSVQIVEAKVIPNKDQTGRNLFLLMKTVDENTDQRGNSMPPGYQLRRYLPLQAKEDAADPDRWQRELAKVGKAVLGTTSWNPSQLVGQTAVIRVKLTNDQAYGLSNDVGDFVEPNTDGNTVQGL